MIASKYFEESKRFFQRRSNVWIDSIFHTDSFSKHNSCLLCNLHGLLIPQEAEPKNTRAPIYCDVHAAIEAYWTSYASD